MYFIAYFDNKHNIVRNLKLSYPNIYDIVANAPEKWDHVQVGRYERDEYFDSRIYNFKFQITNESPLRIWPEKELPICMR